MKTIAQIAIDIGVTRQAIYKKIKQEPLSTSLQGLLVKKNNVFEIDTMGETLIKSAFDSNKPQIKLFELNADIVNQLTDSLQQQIVFLTEQNQDLKNQLKSEREHNQQLTNRIENLAMEMLKISQEVQKNQLNETTKKIDPDDPIEWKPLKKAHSIYSSLKNK